MTSGPGGAPPLLEMAEAFEREAIASHLRKVEAALRLAPTHHLDAQRREARLALLDELQAYHMAGDFPRNVEVPGRAPVFVDDRGTHCAVGYLLHRTGADHIVRSIRESRNLALLPDLLDEPGLPEWLDAHGLTAGEAAWIQPTYCSFPPSGLTGNWYCPWPVNRSEKEVSRGYLLTSIGTSWLGTTAAAVNLLDLREGRPSAGRALFGMAAGAAGMGLGVAGILEGGDTRSVGWANLAVGSLGVSSAVWTFRRASAGGGDFAQAPARNVSLRPWIPEAGGDDGSRSVGVSLSIQR